MRHRLAAGLGVGVLLAGASVAVLAAGQAAPKIEIKTLSTAAARVTGGDVLVQVTAPAGTFTRVSVGDRDVSSAFHAGGSSTERIGLITGLANGKNVIEVRTGTRA